MKEDAPKKPSYFAMLHEEMIQTEEGKEDAPLWRGLFFGCLIGAIIGLLWFTYRRYGG